MKEEVSQKVSISPNILRAGFLYQRFFCEAFLYLHFRLELLKAQENWRKCAQKMLVKLTRVCFLHNNLLFTSTQSLQSMQTFGQDAYVRRKIREQNLKSSKSVFLNLINFKSRAQSYKSFWALIYVPNYLNFIVLGT
jgi:hypothetical protein